MAAQDIVLRFIGNAQSAVAALKSVSESVNKVNQDLEKVRNASNIEGLTKGANAAHDAYSKASMALDLYNKRVQKGVIENSGTKLRTLADNVWKARAAWIAAEQKLAGGKEAQTKINNQNEYWKSLSLVQKTIDGVRGAWDRAKNAVTGYNSELGKINKPTAIQQWQTAIRGLGKTLDSLRVGLMGLNDMFRLSAQAMTNVGRSMMFFVSLPVGAYFTKLTNTAINFEDAMVRVAKTTGLPNQSADSNNLETLAENLQLLARNSPTTHNELAKIAEVIGQMGVTSVNAITNLTHIFDMFVVATDMSAEDVSTSLGQIANAFGWNLNESSEEVFKLANVINQLENTTASSASQIITSMSKFAQAAGTLKITAAEAAGLASTLISVGMSEEEAGTALRRMASQLIANVDEVAKLMSSNEKYADSAKVLKAINEDAVGVFVDIAKAAAGTSEKYDQNAESLRALIDVADERGGRGLAALANNIQLLETNLATANSEFASGTSLVTEYYRAMDSTKSQMAILRNNVNDLGITIGDALLPVINQFIQVAVPAVRMLAEAFKNLSKTQQFMLIGSVALIAIAGPMLMFFGQIFHAITLLVMGFGQFMRVIPLVTRGLAALVPTLATGLKLLAGWPGVIIIGIVSVLKLLQKMGVDIAGVFRNIADTAKAWGENIMGTFAGGIFSGAIRFVARAIEFVANMIASFFEGHSPPDEGPLSNIDKWGSKVLQAYLNGFLNADFGVLKDIGSTIEKILTRGVSEDALPRALAQFAKSRTVLSRLIGKFRTTKILDTNMLNEATAGLGHMGDEIRELITLSLKHIELQEKLRAIEERRKGALATYTDEIKAIGASNMSIEDKVAAIRASQRARDDSLRGLSEEESALKTQSEMMEQQLEFQRQMIDAMNEQDDIFQRIADALEKMKEAQKAASAGGGGGGIGSDFGFDTTAWEEAKTAMADAQESLMEIQDRFETGKRALGGLFDGFAGGEKKIFPYAPELQALYNTMYDLGARGKEIADTFTTAWEGVRISFDNARTSYENLKSAMSGDDPTSNLGKTISGVTDVIAVIGSFAGLVAVLMGLQKAAPYISVVVGSIKDFGVLKTVLDLVKIGFGSLVTKGGLLTGVMTGISTVISTIGWPLLAIAAIIALVAAAFIRNWGGIRDTVVNVIGKIKEYLGPIFTNAVDQLKTAIGNLKKSFEPIVKLFEKASPTFSKIGEKIKEIAGRFVEFVGAIAGATIVGVIGGIVAGITALITGIIRFFAGLVSIVSGIINFVIGVVQIIIGFFQGNDVLMREALERIKEGIIQVLGGIVLVIWGLLEGVFGTIIGVIAGFVYGVIEWFKNLYNILVGNSIIPDMMRDIWNTIVTWLATALSSFVQWVLDVIESITSKISEILEAGKAFIQGLWDGMQEIWETAKETVGGWVEEIAEFITLGITTITQAGRDLIQGLWNGMLEIWESIKTWFNTALSEMPGWLKKLLGIASPSKVMAELGRNTMEGYLVGLQSAFGEVAGFMSNAIGQGISIAASANVSGMTPSSYGLNSAFIGGLGASYELNINDPVVRDEEDIDRLAKEVLRRLGEMQRANLRYGGASF